MEFHPWNTGFGWVDHLEPTSVVTAAQMQQFDREGYFIIDDALHPDTVDDVIAEIAALSPIDSGRVDSPAPNATPAFLGWHDHASEPAAASEFLSRFCAQPLLAGIARDILGPNVRLYRNDALYNPPRSRGALPWHQMNTTAFLRPQAFLNCCIALSHVTAENGCLSLVPGLHRFGTFAPVDTAAGTSLWPDDELPAGAASVDIELRAGSLLVLSSLTPRRTRPNNTDHTRMLYIAQYVTDGTVECPSDGSEFVLQNDPDRQFAVVSDGHLTIPN